MELNAELIVDTMCDCLYEFSDKAPDDAIIVDGLTRKFGFNPINIAAQKGKIAEMVQELPDEFMKEKGGGWTFLNMCIDRHGKFWTGDQARMEELMCLAIACGMAGYLLPRETWAMLPGGVPYVWFDPSAINSPLPSSVKYTSGG